MSLRSVLLLVVALVLVLAAIPAGLLMSRQLDQTLDERARDDLHRAGMVLQNRWEVTAGMRMMHAQDFAKAPELAQALMDGDSSRARSVITPLAESFAEIPVLLAGDGSAIVGPTGAPMELVQATQQGDMPVQVVLGDQGLHLLALAPVEIDGAWVGAAGGATAFGELEAGTLAGLTRSGVIIQGPDGGAHASTEDPETSDPIAAAMMGVPVDSVQVVTAGTRRFLALMSPVSGDARVIFFRDLDDELAVVPRLRRTALVSAAGAMGIGLLLSVLFASIVARPVSTLAEAADRLAEGDVEAPIAGSSVREVDRLADAFDAMRRTLVARLEDLEAMNRELEDRQERLAVLQGELIQRERLAAAGRLVTHLAHEIRNPIASVRNCLELLRRRVENDPEAVHYADMAVDELLRMHELAEQMLEARRPAEPGSSCDATAVATEVASLVDAGPDGGDQRVTVVGGNVQAAVAPEALKQVLFNLVLNAREASNGQGPVEILVTAAGERVRIEVLDRGQGIDAEALPRIFDPFFTTKAEVHGVGLGLFTAEATVRTYGGRISAENRGDGPGARFTVDLPAA